MNANKIHVVMHYSCAICRSMLFSISSKRFFIGLKSVHFRAYPILTLNLKNAEIDETTTRVKIKKKIRSSMNNSIS